MKRITIQDPLAGAQAGLPNIRSNAPVNRPIGAAAPADYSGIRDLANALSSWNRPLSMALQISSEDAQDRATRMAEAKASTDAAWQKMDQLENMAKAAADAGQISHVATPAYIRAYRERAAEELAMNKYQPDLMNRLNEATRTNAPVDPAQIIAETRKSVGALIDANDVFGASAFHNRATQLDHNFMEQAVKQRYSNLQQGSEDSFKTAVVDKALALAADPSANVDAYLNDKDGTSGIMQLYDKRRNKEVPEWRAKKDITEAIGSAVSTLIGQKRFDEAQHLMDSMKDPTGNTRIDDSEFKLMMANQSASLEQHRYTHDAQDRTRRQEQWELNTKSGESQAWSEVGTAAGNGDFQKPEMVERLQKQRDAVLQQHKDDAAFCAGYSQVFNQQLQLHTGKMSYDNSSMADVAEKINTLNPTEQNNLRATVVRMSKEGSCPPDWAARQLNTIDANGGKSGYITAKLNQMSSHFLGKRETQLGVEYTPKMFDVSKLPKTLQDVWDRDLSGNEAAVNEIAHMFEEDCRREMYNRANSLTGNAPDQQQQVDQLAYDIAKGNAGNMGRYIAAVAPTYSKIKLVTTEAQRQQATKQAIDAQQALDQHIPEGMDYTKPFDPTVERVSTMGRSQKPVAYKKDITVPEQPVITRADRDKLNTTVSCDRDLVPLQRNVSKWVNMNGQSTAYVDMKALSKRLSDEAVPLDERNRDREIYMLGKAKLGFSEKELTSGVTKHNVQFDAAALGDVSNIVTVFPTRGDLESAWNNGQPNESFNKIKSLVDPNNKMNPTKFYQNQISAFTAKQPYERF